MFGFWWDGYVDARRAFARIFVSSPYKQTLEEVEEFERRTPKFSRALSSKHLTLRFIMVDSGHVQQIRQWLASERLEIRDKNDPRADAHFLVRYPPALKATCSQLSCQRERFGICFEHDSSRFGSTRTNEGTHERRARGLVRVGTECRLSLMRAELDWGIHMGHQGKEKPGPLQAFNVSLPIWHDGLNKNALMPAYAAFGSPS